MNNSSVQDPINLEGYDQKVARMYNRKNFDIKSKDKLQSDHRCYQEVTHAKSSNKDLIKVDLSLVKNDREAYMILKIKKSGKPPIGAEKKGIKDFVVRNGLNLTEVG